MISYDASSLDSNRTLLQEFHKIEDYLKRNPVYKCYALNQNYVSGVSQYSIADLVASESELAEGDVVIFANAYVGFVSSVGEEYFSVINVSNIQGPRGPQGIQGPQGPAGADGQDGEDGADGQDGQDGVDALFYDRVMIVEPVVDTTYVFNPSYFNRTPVVSEDEFYSLWHVSASNKSYLTINLVQSQLTSGYICRVLAVLEVSGPAGVAGPSALCYDRNIPFTHQGGGGSLEAFTVGDTLANGDKIHFDTTKGNELGTYLATLTYTQENPFAFLLNANDLPFIAAVGQDGIYALSIGETFVYSTQAVAEAGIIEGFQNLDANGDFTIVAEGTATVSAIYDTNPATWNGVIFGVEGESQPVSEQLISVTLPFANFNRTPELNQDFVGILEDSGVCYVAQCEVQTISGTNVTSIVASDINRLTGEKGADGQDGTDGTDGTNGTDGKDALVCNAIYQPETNPSLNQYISLNSSYYNRTPIVNEYYPLIWKGANSRSFVCMMRVDSVPGAVSSQVISYLETTGAQGASGTTLNKYSATLSFSSSSDRTRFVNIIRNAKGKVEIEYKGGCCECIDSQEANRIRIIGTYNEYDSTTTKYELKILYFGMTASGSMSYSYIYTLGTTGTSILEISNISSVGTFYVRYWNDSEITS